MSSSCPVEQSTGRGRPRFYIPEEVIRGLREVHGVWKEVAKEALVSYKTILRRRHQYSMAVDKTRNLEHPGTFRNIPEHRIIIIIMRKKCVKLNFGLAHVTV